MISNISKRYFSSIVKKADVIIFDYKTEICNGSVDLSEKIERAYGSNGVGLAVVKNIPNYEQYRLDLLPLAKKVADLPPNRLKSYERPESFYSVGWSCGVEKFFGKPDFAKGSFYANPITNDPPKADEYTTQKEFQGLLLPNIWPTDDIPEVEKNFMKLGNLMFKVGLQLLGHIDKYVEKRLGQDSYEQGKLARIMNNPDNQKGRLLHYYPAKEGELDEGWCGWHNDHSALTALTAAIFQDKNGNIIKCPDEESGLYAKNRFSDIMKVAIPQDMLAFQIGETAQILTGGVVEATPHCVVQGKSLENTGISRSTFPVFMGPYNYEKLIVPKGINPQQAMSKGAYKIPPLEERWDPKNDTFFTFGGKTLSAYNN